jgi:Tfp pilus assembly protein PilO
MRLTRVRLARLIAAVLLLALTAVLWLFVLQPRQAAIEVTRSDIADAELMQQALIKRDTELRSLLSQAPTVAQEAQDLFAALPRTAQLPELLDQITAAAIDAGIPASDISVINTSIPAPIADIDPETAASASELGVDLGAINIDLSVTGSETEFLTFLENLTTLERAFLVQSTSVSTTRDGGAEQSMTVSGRLFVLQSSLPDLVAAVEELVTRTTQGQ